MRRVLLMALAVVILSQPGSADNPNSIFYNGFESGDTCLWDLAVPQGGFCSDANTIALWRFNEASGQVLTDSSGHGRDLTLGPTTAAETEDPSRDQGIFGNALYFDSTLLQYANGTGSNSFPSNQLTAEIWVKPQGGSGSGGSGQIFTAGSINCVITTRTITNNVYFAVGDGSDWQAFYGSVSGVDLDDGNWHYLAMTYDGSTLVGYIDGEVAGTLASVITLASPADYKVGGRPENTFLDGWMDDVRLSDVARSAGEISKVWQNSRSYR
jgi:hypothetical protein